MTLLLDHQVLHLAALTKPQLKVIHSYRHPNETCEEEARRCGMKCGAVSWHYDIRRLTESCTQFAFFLHRKYCP